VTTGVMAAVLGAALLHALWNSVVKSADDKFLTSARVCLWCGLIAFASALALPTPYWAAAWFVLASAIIHVVYFVLVGRLYRNADLSVAYPLMRGLAHGRVDRATIGVALVNSVIIASYSVIDGEGARLAGPSALHAFAYNAWADAMTGALYLPILLLYRGPGATRYLMRNPLISAAGGLAAFTGYALVVWAMTQTAIGAVAALRECSVVFAAVIGVVFLGEPFKRARAAAALLILAGVVALKLA